MKSETAIQQRLSTMKELINILVAEANADPSLNEKVLLMKEKAKMLEWVLDEQ